MSDFDLEQLKTLFQNLGDQMEQTEGDKDSLAELQKMRALMTLMAKTMTQSTKPGGHRRENKEFIDQFWQMWRQQNPLGSLKTTGSKKDPEGTIVQQLLREQRRKNKNGLTDAEDKVYLNKFHKNLDEAGTGMKEFGGSLRKATDGVGNFFDNIKKGGLLTALGGGTGSLLGKTEATFNGMTDSYRKIKAAGDGSVVSIEEMNKAANNAYMNANELAEAFNNASSSTKKLGALKFTQLQTSLIDATRGANQLGLSFEDYRKVTSDYTDMLEKRGQLFDQDNTQMTNGIIRMVKASEQTAAILGISRDEAIKARMDAQSDASATDLMQRRHQNMTAAGSRQELLESVGGKGAAELFRSLATNTRITEAGKNLASANPALFKLILNEANKQKNSRDNDGSDKKATTDLTNALRAYGREMKNSKLGEQMDILGAGQVDGLGTTMNATGAETTNRALSLKDPATVKTPEDAKPATKSAQDIRDEQQILANEANKATSAFFNPIVSNPTLMKDMYGGMKDLQGGLDTVAKWMEDHPTFMEGLGVVVIATTGLFAALNLAMGATLAILAPVKGAKTMWSLGSKLLGRGAAGAAEAGAAEGGTVIGAEAAGAAGAGGAAAGGGGLMAAGAAALPFAGAALAGGAGIYGIGKFGQQMDKRKGESFLGTGKNEKGFWGSRGSAYLGAAGSGLAGGAAAGALLGGPVGALIGGAIGGVGGLAWAGYKDYVNHDGTKVTAPKNAADMHKRLSKINPAVGAASKASNAVTPPAVNDNRARPAPINPAKPNTPAPAVPVSLTPGKKAMTMDDMTHKIMDATDRAAIHLKAIRDNTEQQVALMREDIIMTRSHNERVQRLMEENNRNTKRSADSSH